MNLKNLRKMIRLASMLCLGIFIMAGSSHSGFAAGAMEENMKESDTMKQRVENANERYQKLFENEKMPEETTDPDFANTMKRFIYGEVEQQGNLSDQERALITLVILETTGNEDLFAVNVKSALHVGVMPIEIKEAIYQVAPYVGFPKALEALRAANQIFVQQGIQLPLENQSTVTESTRFEKGLAIQKEIFGDSTINMMYEKAAKEQLHFQHYLSGYCFGDTYTRRALDLKMREMLTMAAIAALGGCEPQLKAHIQGNLNVGNSKETIVSVITECVPYIGFPRSLNAMRCVNEVFEAATKAK